MPENQKKYQSWNDLAKSWGSDMDYSLYILIYIRLSNGLIFLCNILKPSPKLVIVFFIFFRIIILFILLQIILQFLFYVIVIVLNFFQIKDMIMKYIIHIYQKIVSLYKILFPEINGNKSFITPIKRYSDRIDMYNMIILEHQILLFLFTKNVLYQRMNYVILVF